MNLLEETIEVLRENNHEPQDVLWVGSEDGYITWDEFANVSTFKYDNGYDIEQIAFDLVVVGKDFWLERHEYDGSEWWEYKHKPVKPRHHMHVETLSRHQQPDYYGVDLRLIKLQGNS